MLKIRLCCVLPENIRESKHSYWWLKFLVNFFVFSLYWDAPVERSSRCASPLLFYDPLRMRRHSKNLKCGICKNTIFGKIFYFWDCFGPMRLASSWFEGFIYLCPLLKSHWRMRFNGMIYQYSAHSGKDEEQ